MPGSGLSTEPVTGDVAVAGARRRRHRSDRRGPAARVLAPLACMAGAMTALGTCWYQLAQPHVLYGVLQYDDGVYLAASLQLSAGRFPYRDFALIQPPGVPVLMLPVAFLGHLVGSREAMALARILTALVCAACCFLAGWLLRHRGPLAALVASGLLAIFPADFSADRTLLLEPYLVLFCLIGAVLAFEGDRITGSTRRLVLAGAAYGIAGTCKVWAAFPFAVLAIVIAVAARRRVVPYLAGTFAGFALFCGPFALSAPGAFWQDVIVAQFARTSRLPTPAGQRLAYLDGVRQTRLAIPPSNQLGVEVAVVLGALLAATVVLPLVARRGTPLEWFVVLAATASTVIMFVPRVFYSHYAYLPDAFIGLAIALGADRCRRLVLALVRPGESRARRRLMVGTGALLGAAALAGAGIVVGSETGFARLTLAGVGDPGPAIARVLPAGSCALTDAASILIGANRYSVAPGCPAVVDSTGLWIAASPDRPPLVRAPRDPALVAGWERRLSHAGYLVTLTRTSFRIPWDGALDRWFARHYRLVAVSGAFIFERVPPARS